MSVINAVPLLAAAGGDYTISRSVRLRSSASAYFNRTPASAGTSNKTFTYSAWVKRGSLGSIQNLISSPNTGNSDSLRFSAADALEYNWQDTVVGQVTTTQVFRDPSAWYHIMFAMDTTQATASNRFKLYVNGVQVTAFSTANYPAQNTVVNNTAAVATKLGQYANSSTQNFDGYLTEINFIDGQALTPTSFGQFNSVTGVWQPLKYTGTYGTNGFYLNFSDNSNNTAATIGKDYSGNGNNWTPNNISVTSGTTYDSMLDVPTPYADGGNGRGNYAVLNPLWKSASGNGTFYDGNLSYYSVTNAYWQNAESSIAVSSGKWYWEVVQTAGYSPSGSTYIGIAPTVWSGAWPGADASSYAFYTGDGKKYNGGTGSTYGSVCVNGDVIGVALDLDNGTIAFYKNGSAIGTAYTGISGTFAPVIAVITNSSVVTYASANFGQRLFAYTPPSGFVALNTQNLPDSTIKKGNQYFDVSLWTGNGASRSIVNSGAMQPDFAWIKSRSNALNSGLMDSVRGPTKLLISNATNAEQTLTDELTSFNSDGFSLGASSNGYTNFNTYTYVAWQWQAGAGTTSSNTAGSITSTVSVNATAGFSVVTYTGTGANATVGHGLGVAPKMVIVKCRNAAATSWAVYHANQNATPQNGALLLESTAAYAVSSAYWNNTAPTSSLFTVGTGSAVNTNTNTYVAYCWAAVAGYSAFGSYTGNGSSDGPFVFLGFRPRYLLIKSSDTASTNWEIIDTSRNTYNVANNQFSGANSSNAEYTGYTFGDILSNGFKIRDSSSGLQGNYNTNGATYVYAAFAENPFKFSLAR